MRQPKLDGSWIDGSDIPAPSDNRIALGSNVYLENLQRRRLVKYCRPKSRPQNRKAGNSPNQGVVSDRATKGTYLLAEDELAER